MRLMIEEVLVGEILFFLLWSPHGQSPCLHAEVPVFAERPMQATVSARRRGLLRREIKYTPSLFPLQSSMKERHLEFFLKIIGIFDFP